MIGALRAQYYVLVTCTFVASLCLMIFCMFLTTANLFPFLFSHSDVFASSVWSIIQEVKDPVLRNLAAQLPQTVSSSRANSTTKYLYAYSRWRNWADQIQVPTGLPVSETYLVLYMQHLSATTNSRSAVETIVNAINEAHELAGHSSISKSPIVSSTLKALQRSLANLTVKKEPVTPEMLHRLVNSMDSKPKLFQVRLVTVALIAYAAFLRYDELAKIRCCDIKFLEDCMMIFYHFQ